jgi:PAS domain-containing protein
MAKGGRKSAATDLRSAEEVAPVVRIALDALTFGSAVFGQDLKLVACNRAFRDLRGYPAALCRPGAAIADLYRFNAERGDYGPGDIEGHVRARLARARSRRQHELNHELANGRILTIRCAPLRRHGPLRAQGCGTGVAGERGAV